MVRGQGKQKSDQEHGMSLRYQSPGAHILIAVFSYKDVICNLNKNNFKRVVHLDYSRLDCEW